MTQYASTDRGDAVVKFPDTPLAELQAGDYVLGLRNCEEPDAPRTVYLVTAGLGKHRVPTEDPSRLERFLIGAGLDVLVSGSRVEGVLVDNERGYAGLFALESTPVLDVVDASSLRN